MATVEVKCCRPNTRAVHDAVTHASVLQGKLWKTAFANTTVSPNWSLCFSRSGALRLSWWSPYDVACVNISSLTCHLRRRFWFFSDPTWLFSCSLILISFMERYGWGFWFWGMIYNVIQKMCIINKSPAVFLNRQWTILYCNTRLLFLLIYYSLSHNLTWFIHRSNAEFIFIFCHK